MGRRKSKISPRKTYLLIVDGETEIWYFNMLKRNERQLKINIKPELPTKKKLSEQYNKVISSSENYTKVFWIVDFDTIVSETRTAKKGTETPLDEFCKYKRFSENYCGIINS